MLFSMLDIILHMSIIYICLLRVLNTNCTTENVNLNRPKPDNDMLVLDQAPGAPKNPQMCAQVWICISSNIFVHIMSWLSSFSRKVIDDMHVCARARAHSLSVSIAL